MCKRTEIPPSSDLVLVWISFQVRVNGALVFQFHPHPAPRQMFGEDII